MGGDQSWRQFSQMPVSGREVTSYGTMLSERVLRGSTRTWTGRGKSGCDEILKNRVCALEIK